MDKLAAVKIVVFLLWVEFSSAQAEESCKGCLLLTPFINNGSVTLARELSRVNDKELLGIESYTGFLAVKEEYGSQLFYWFIPASTKLEETPWIIWLGGGPGVTSLMGLFNLIGPWQFVDGLLTSRSVTWASSYSLLFIDNPVGAGFSFTMDDKGYPDNEDDVGDQMYNFLQQFLDIFPELRKAPLFIAGESYAGKYVPALGIQINRRKGEGLPINLKGMAIGNGLIDPETMMHYSTLCETLGILDDAQLNELKVLEQATLNYIHEQRIVDASNKFNETIEYIKKHSGVSIYNFEKDPTPFNAATETFLMKKETRELIHVGNVEFNYNNQLVYNKMLPDIMNTSKPLVEELLEHYGIMHYSGNLDVIIPYIASKHTYKSMRWSRSEEYTKASRINVKLQSDGPIVAYKKSGGNFVDVVVRKTGHQVPLEEPEVMKYIIDDFINAFK